MTTEEIENRFTYHAPNEVQRVKYAEIREYARLLAHRINKACPESREKSLAITKLQEVIAWANASIACNPSPASSIPSGTQEDHLAK
jgi:hypothetical protein